MKNNDTFLFLFSLNGCLDLERNKECVFSKKRELVNKTRQQKREKQEKGS